MEYKKTLNLPKTEFPMKANLPAREPALLKDWLKQDIYKLIRKQSKQKPLYILHDGPPYANGDIHLGHVLNKTLKDIVVKYRTMQGFDSPFVPGWDCHGLPVEHQLFKELGINKYQINQSEFRKKAYQYALRFVGIQKEQFKRLGVFGDWENPYLTLDSSYEEAIVRSFGALSKNNFLYRGLKPVNWCFVCETALAEAEVEYENHISSSIYVKFQVDPRSSILDPGSDENQASSIEHPAFLVIWTTTPWTLIANVAVAVHPNFTYSYIKTEKGNLILAKDLLAQAVSAIGIEKYELIKEIKGIDLEGINYLHPFGLRKGKVVSADYVSKEEGSGLVHTAPGHGNEDYLTGLKYKLEIVMPVDSKGKFDSSAGEFQGVNVLEANKAIIEKLKKNNSLLLDFELKHSYPHCWRCRNPVIFRATKQWFLKIDHNDLRKKVLEAAKKKVKWVPASGEERITSMVEERPDWCLSRQRYWGVPIPALVCDKCKEEVLDPRVIEKFADFVTAEGTDSWFKREVKDFIPDDFKCLSCKNDHFIKGSDILDVWFDSGVSHQAVLKKRGDLGRKIPCALYLEGSDQHRGWFQSSLITAMGIDGIPPFESVLTHGFVVDGKGRKMSKSLGNVISPLEVIKDYGADILRLWVASSDYNEDIRISDLIISRLSEAYRKIRNTLRFSLSNLYDFNPREQKIEYSKLKKIDRRILVRLQQMIKSVTEAYENFHFHKAYKNIYDFCNEDLSMYYLDMVKGRLYTSAADSLQRRAAQTAIYEVVTVLVRLMAPILTFTSEETYKHLPVEEKVSHSSVHLLEWPKVDPAVAGDKIDTELEPIFELIPEISKLLEEERACGNIGSSFDAQINLLTKDDFRYKYLWSLEDDLCEILKVSKVNIAKEGNIDAGVKSEKFPEISIGVKKAQGEKCLRCWNYSLSVGSSKKHPLICQRCLEALREE
ncbi:MAG: isoleucine--tRNA ligase [Candidatus Omnitrophica bacterium]|nr:isoleucine--tRNA ligase [Candidatus Omnitrophota bacterium]